jgi:hypothetical protein
MSLSDKLKSYLKQKEKIIWKQVKYFLQKMEKEKLL